MLTFPIKPMKAKLGTLPADDERWAYEIKWDGYRTIAFVSPTSASPLRLQSTSGLDMTERWPELGNIAASINATSVVLDGEMCVLDDEGKPRFELIQRSERPAVFHIFDVLEIDGHDLTSLPYENRRSLLEGVVEPGPNWLVPAHRVGGGADLLVATAAAGLEGVMAKRLGSTYRAGSRSDDWRKIKNRQRIQVTIGGFTLGTGSRAATFGALLVGLPTEDGLAFAGGVGTGFNDTTLRSLTTRLRTLVQASPPFSTPVPPSHRRGASWVRPELRAMLEIAELTNEGYVRHASFIGLVDD